MPDGGTRIPVRTPDRRLDAPGVLDMLDVIYVAATLALFALVGLIAKAVEKL